MNGIPYELVLVVLFRLIQIALILLLVGLLIHWVHKKIYKYVDKRLNISPKRLTRNKSKSLK